MTASVILFNSSMLNCCIVFSLYSIDTHRWKLNNTITNKSLNLCALCVLRGKSSESRITLKSQPQSFCEPNRWTIIQFLAGKRQVRTQARNATWRVGVINNFRVAARHILHALDEITYACFFPRTNVDDQAIDVGCSGCRDQSADHIVYINIITSLTSIAMRDQSPAAECLLQVVRHNRRM